MKAKGAYAFMNAGELYTRTSDEPKDDEEVVNVQAGNDHDR